MTGRARGAPALLGGTRNRVPSLEQAVRRGPKRTGARTFAQIRAVWERRGFSRRPCRRLGAPASVAPAPAGPVCHAHRCPRGSDIRRLVCPSFVVRRHGLHPAVSDYGCPRVKHGQPCGRRGNSVEGRSDRILPRQERSSNRPPPACPAGAEVLVARRTAFPRHVRPRPVLWSAAIHCRFGTARERSAPAHLSPLSAFSTSAKAAMNRRTPKAPARGRPCSAGRDPKPCATAWNKQCGAARNEQGHGRLPKSVRCGSALGFRVGLAADWVRLLRSLPRRPDRGRTPTAVRAGPISGGSSAHLSSYVDTACNQHGLHPAVSDYGCPRVKHGQPCGRRGNSVEGRSDRILPRQERSSNRPPPACPAGAEVLVARRTAFPRHVRPRPVLWSAAIHCRFGTARERMRTAHLSPLSAFSTSAKAAMNRRTPKAPARGRPCSAGRDPKPCATWNEQCGAARDEQVCQRCQGKRRDKPAWSCG